MLPFWHALTWLQLTPSRLLATMGVVWAADTAAYFTGRAFGRHKLAPQISPGKTWEGVAGAAALQSCCTGERQLAAARALAERSRRDWCW